MASSWDRATTHRGYTGYTATVSPAWSWAYLRGYTDISLSCSRPGDGPSTRITCNTCYCSRPGAGPPTLMHYGYTVRRVARVWQTVEAAAAIRNGRCCPSSSAARPWDRCRRWARRADAVAGGNGRDIAIGGTTLCTKVHRPTKMSKTFSPATLDRFL